MRENSLTFTAIRYDFVAGLEGCAFCPREIPTECAYVLKADDGSTVYAGPVCAKKHASNGHSLSQIPNLTKGHIALITRVPKSPKNGGRSGGSAENIVDKQRLLAEEYLLLRELKLAQMNNSFSYDVLAEYLRAMEEGCLTDKQINHILNIESKAPELLKRSELQAKYICLSLIERGLEKWSDNHVLAGIKSTLLTKRRFVTAKQVTSINNIVASKGISRQVNPKICRSYRKGSQ